MPNWIPRQQTVQEQLADEIAKQEAIRFVQQSQRNESPVWNPLLTESVNNSNNIPELGTPLPKIGIPRVSRTTIDPAISVRPVPKLTPIQQEIASYMPDEYRPPEIQKRMQPITTQAEVARLPRVEGVTVPSEKASPVNKTDVKPAEPFWQRALQVFAAPFNWVDEYLIKPALSVAGTAVGIVPEAQRKPGEEFWSWKRRSWSEMPGGPGIDIKLPLRDTPFRIDLKGLAEFAPWLLIPGAGQVGSATRTGAGIAGVLGKAGKVGKVAGVIVEWSPWGLAEKTAGAVIKGTLKAGLKGSEYVSTKLEEKVFGKIKKIVPTKTEQELTQFFKDAVVPQRKAFEKALPELRARQEAMASKYLEQGRKGIIPQAQAVELAAQARAGGIKEQFAIRPPTKLNLSEIENKAAKSVEGQIAWEGIPMGEAHQASWEFQLSTHDTIDNVLNAHIAHPINGKFVPAGVVQTSEGARVALDKQLIANTSIDDMIKSDPSIKGLVSAKDFNNDKVKFTEFLLEHEREHLRIASEGLYYPTKIEEELATARALRKLLPTIEGVPLNDPVKVNEILSKINSGAETGLATVDDAWAMRNLLLTGELPEPAHIKSFAKIFGQEFADAVSGLKGVKPSFLDNLWDTLNIPRSVMASGDLSGTFRQGLILTLNHPIEGIKAFGKQLKAFASEKIAGELDDTLRAHPLYNVAKNDWGVDFTAVRKGATQGKEEVFISTLAEHLPGIRRSERAYTTYLNQMRMAAVEKAHAPMAAQGATKEQFKVLGDFINYSTGRGKLPFTYEKYAPMFNSLLFSPKYQASILQLPGQIGKMLISKNPYVRKQGALALTTFVGGGSALIGLVQATGKGSVELDPRSVDFAKLKIGETRVDIWRGYAQYVRFANQMLMGQRKSAYGNLSNAERGEIAGRFIQSKLSPAAGLLADLWRNETYDGKPVFSDTKGFAKAAKEHILPLAVQDVMDAMEQSGVNGLWTAIPAALGIGVLTYVNDYVKTKDKVAKENGYDSWDEIDPKTQLEIERNSAEIQAAEITYDRQVMGTAWGDWHLAGKSIEELFRENVGLSVAQFKETGDGAKFREKIADAYTQRKGGYDVREKEPRFADIVDRLNTQDLTQASVTLGPEQLAIKIYQDALYGDDMYDQFGDYRFDEAEIRKEQLRFKLGDETYKYVEDYTGGKTADLPPEFQELKKAKIVLRPYWEIQDKIERLFGKRFAENPRGQSMISKLRKQMRATRPDVAKYYQLFYANQ